jgi:hypothetical protein
MIIAVVEHRMNFDELVAVQGAAGQSLRGKA